MVHPASSELDALLERLEALLSLEAVIKLLELAEDTTAELLDTDELDAGELVTGKLDAGKLDTDELTTDELTTDELDAGKLETAELDSGTLDTDELDTEGALVWEEPDEPPPHPISIPPDMARHKYRLNFV
ncbi:hypothetical protein [Cellvibrio sp. QJXJ]|uniref:hypothetical protein n=1 Tax=Cellvibrio sp. QJXJ TaxID=2964606 RepID=UPI0021C29CEC|nr:hypothetical protein [Cellvibrio sp. QJXJ]UUA73583.1 hypothetical protein NNX04_03840 [Cellvibrio sp. QJXJ]